MGVVVVFAHEITKRKMLLLLPVVTLGRIFSASD